MLASHGQEALDILAKDGRFDGVLMDCQMPVMDGYTATRQIRQNPAFTNLPIIAMTANAMAGDKEKVLEAGMWDHIAKPLNVGAMFATLAKWIKLGSAVPALAENHQDTTDSIASCAVSTRAGGQNDAKNETAASASGKPSVKPVGPYAALNGIDTQAGLSTTMNNGKFYARMLGKFLDSQGNFATLFAAARADADPSAAARAAHTLKGTASNIGARQVQAAAALLEQACQQGAAEDALTGLLQDVLAALAPVLQGLRVFCGVADMPVEPVEAASAAVASAGPSGADLDRLERLIRDSDGDAEDLMEELLAQPMSPAMARALEKTAAALEQFDFDAALAALLTARKQP